MGQNISRVRSVEFFNGELKIPLAFGDTCKLDFFHLLASRLGLSAVLKAVPDAAYELWTTMLWFPFLCARPVENPPVTVSIHICFPVSGFQSAVPKIVHFLGIRSAEDAIGSTC